MNGSRFSDAQIRALRVLANASGNGSRISNGTGGLFIHEGTGASLERQGLVEWVAPRVPLGHPRYRLTALGRSVVAALGIEVET